MATLFERFSSRENLKLAYTHVQHELSHSTLSVNPINHPATTAIDALGGEFFVALEKQIRDGNYAPEKGFFVYIPKDNLALRPVYVMSMIDRIVFQAIFNQEILGYKIDNQLSDKSCFGNRVHDNAETPAFIAPYFNDWDKFCEGQKKAFEKGLVWKLEVDVQQYYEHIPIGKLMEKIKNDFGIKDEKILSILDTQLRTWTEFPDLPKGLPQGPGPSAVLANAYLASLDEYIEEELAGKNFRYLRYVDDLVLMGRSKEDVLKATEKIVRFLRGHNLNLNEKTKVTELQDTEAIEAMRISSDYDYSTPEIPEDDFARITATIPRIIGAIISGEKVEKLEIRGLKYYLKASVIFNLNLILDLIKIIPIRPSLTVPIIQYIADSMVMLDIFGDPLDAITIDSALWEAYNNSEVTDWSKFWILKLLASNKSIIIGELDQEIDRILSEKETTIFKVVALYHKAIREQDIDIELVKRSMKEASSGVEKSLYSFFLLNTFDGLRSPVIQGHIENALNATSPEMNLIGYYLHQRRTDVHIQRDEIKGNLSPYLLKRQPRKPQDKAEARAQKTTKPESQDYYIVPGNALIPIASPPEIFGIRRAVKKRHSIDLVFPEVVKFEKVEIKFKEGAKEIEIYYDGKYIAAPDYVQLGFSRGKKQQKPTREWNFLEALSALAATDIHTATAQQMTRMVAARSNISLKLGNVYQIKRLLVKSMRSIFKTDDDPFHARSDYYDPKFKLLPVPGLRQNDIWRQGGRLNENQLAIDDSEE